MNESEARKVILNSNVEIDCTDNRSYLEIAVILGLVAVTDALNQPITKTKKPTINEV